MDNDAAKDKIRETVTVQAVMEKHGVLKGSGTPNYMCPIHGETKESLSINQVDGASLYNCFACDASGDVFKMEMELTGCTFPEAVRSLRVLAGLPEEVKKKAKKSSKKDDYERPVSIKPYFYRDCLGEEVMCNVRKTYADGKKTFTQARPARPEEVQAGFGLDDKGEIIVDNYGQVKVRDGLRIELASGEWTKLYDGLAVVKSVAEKTGFRLNWSLNAEHWYKSGNPLIYKTEGEKDAMILQDIPGVNATCIAGGGKKSWTNEAVENLKAGGIEEVVHFFDADKPGFECVLRDIKLFEKRGIKQQSIVFLKERDEFTKGGGWDVYDELSPIPAEKHKGVLDYLVRSMAKKVTPELIKVLEDTVEMLAKKFPPQKAINTAVALNRPKKKKTKSINGKLKDKEFEETDAGNVEMLVDLHGEDIRYIPDRALKTFVVWTPNSKGGGCWRFAEDSDLLEFTKSVYRARLEKAEELPENDDILKEIKARAIRFAKSCQNENRRNSMIRLLKGERALWAKANEFDEHRMLLNCENGTVDLRSGLFYKARREDMLMKSTGIVFDPQAKCERFESVVKMAMQNKMPLVYFLQRWFGYCTSGDIGEEVMCVFYGPKGRNGKTKICEGITHALGEYADPAPSDFLVQKDRGEGVPTDMADLEGRRFVTISEPEGNSKLATSKMKLLIGGDTFKARRMGKDFRRVTPTHKMTLLTNEKPKVNSTEANVWDKIILVLFEYMIPKEQRDKKLDSKLRAEASGILNWLVEGCLAWQREGLNAPEELLQASNKWKRDEDYLADFIEDCLVQDDSKDSRGRPRKITKSKVFELYEEYCKKHNCKAYDSRFLGSILKRRGWKDKKSGPTRYWLGWREPTMEETHRAEQEARMEEFGGGVEYAEEEF